MGSRDYKLECVIQSFREAGPRTGVYVCNNSRNPRSERGEKLLRSLFATGGRCL